MKIVLEPQNHTFSDGYSVRKCKIKRINSNKVVDEKEIWFQIEKSVPLPLEDDCDAYLLAVLMDAMRENRRIEVLGSVSKYLLSNLVEFQAAWAKWRPTVYSCVDIFATMERHDHVKKNGAICAFSGGVDATFSVWRHFHSKYSHRSQTLNACSIVHGFDIPLSHIDAFESAKKRAQDTLGDIGLNLTPTKTNFREISKAHWEDACSLALVAALNNFKNIAGTCIIGSSEPYDSLVIPWGSSPITDHLLSSGDFSVIHDGASHNRTEKVREISEWHVGANNLRVCWQGDLKDRNCGSCEKCVRTKLNFLAIGSPIPDCFPSSNILDDIKNVELKSNLVRSEWQQIYDYALNRKTKEAWPDEVKKQIDKTSGPAANVQVTKKGLLSKFAKSIRKRVRKK